MLILRGSIVLLITLALIAAISSMIAIGMGFLDRSEGEIEKKHAFIQTIAFTQDTVSILNKKAKEINSSDALDLLVMTPIELKTDEMELAITFDSAAKGINPNNLIKIVNKKKRINADYVLLFDRILQNANVQNKELFLAMLEDSLDDDLNERLPGSEIALYDRRFAQGRIESLQKFMMIVDHYVKTTEDSAIYAIPWKRILSFYAKDIDFNYIDPYLLRQMLPFLDEEQMRKFHAGGFEKFEDLHLPREDIDELKRYNVTFFVPVIEVNMTAKGQGRSSFIYNIEKRKVLDIGYRI